MYFLWAGELIVFRYRLTISQNIVIHSVETCAASEVQKDLGRTVSLVSGVFFSVEYPLIS